MKTITLNEIFIIILAICLCIFGIIFLDRIFSASVSGLNQEIFSAVLASVFTVAAMTIVMRLQSKQEKEKEFASIIFEKKLIIYQQLLKILFKADDDNILSDDEIQQIENKIGEASIMANANLVSCFSQFMLQLKIYGCLYPRSMDNEQRQHYLELAARQSFLSENKRNIKSNLANFDKIFVTVDDLLQGIRHDLNVVEGDIQEHVGRFISIPIGKYKMKRNPNLID